MEPLLMLVCLLVGCLFFLVITLIRMKNKIYSLELDLRTEKLGRETAERSADDWCSKFSHQCLLNTEMKIRESSKN